MLRIIGAGLPRTATTTLKTALPTLLGEPCYHMTEVFEHPDHLGHWRRAADGEPVDWKAFYDGYAATVDFPSAPFWPQLAEIYPDALILLSTRTSGAAWWKSMDATIMERMRQEEVTPEVAPFREVMEKVWRRAFGRGVFDDPRTGEAAYDAYVRHVRDTAPPERLLEWSAAQGWEPICAALGVDVPKEPFPHVNSTEEWKARIAEGGRPPFLKDVAEG